ncbi:hypothetical protein FRX31_015633 [Thalictrum thalictroides]|uniref:Uncharacterized protein n=1 Tax=Thalictrum thalictroides TaxID=46969 RepID=A0A7J6WD31_THATH|nr:hypothetical protein FRX31_015633 [Thalictrum thalictroides]
METINIDNSTRNADMEEVVPCSLKGNNFLSLVSCDEDNGNFSEQEDDNEEVVVNGETSNLATYTNEIENTKMKGKTKQTTENAKPKSPVATKAMKNKKAVVNDPHEETKVRQNNATRIMKNCSPNWFTMDNYNEDPSGRIWILWDHNFFQITKVNSSKQFIHCQVRHLPTNFVFYSTFVYASNNRTERGLLWDNLVHLSSSITTPWCVMGDFNNVMFSNERIGGQPVHPRETRDFVETMHAAGLTDLKSIGFFYTLD